MAIYQTNQLPTPGAPGYPTVYVPVTKLEEHPIYGSSRLGVHYRQSGTDAYQLTDHLGNVRAVIMKNGGNAVSLTAKTDYYPFGMPMPNRNVEGNYRYKFQGQEKDPETGMEAFELRLWDSRIGRWLTTDPAGQYASPYLGMGNNPISRIDPDGGEDDWVPTVNADGSTSYVAEAGDTAQTFADQYGVSLDQAQSLIGTDNIQAGITAVSGQSVFNMNPYGLDSPSEVLNLQLGTYMSTEQRVIDQFSYAIQHSASKGATAWKATQYFGNVYKQLQTPRDYKGVVDIGGKKADINIYLQWYTSSGYWWKTKYHQSFFGNNLNSSPQANGSMFGKDRNITHSQIGFGYLINGKAVWQRSGSIQLTVHTKNANAFQKQLFTEKPNYNYIFTGNGGTKN